MVTSFLQATLPLLYPNFPRSVQWSRPLFANFQNELLVCYDRITGLSGFTGFCDLGNNPGNLVNPVILSKDCLHHNQSAMYFSKRARAS
jgi:hypothetical protein